jgi:HEPN superfamily RiboL-PSP-like protein
MTTLGTSSSLAPSSKLLAKAASIFVYASASASSLLVAFDDAKAKRGNPRGVLTDQEQDILRAVLVMSCAGLDGSLKQAIRDCLEHLLEKNKVVRDGFEKFIRKRISGEGDVLELAGGAKFLALMLADKEPRKRLIEEYIKELAGESLQSVEEIMRTVAALGLDQKALTLDVSKLREIFGIRNKIIHELDIDLDAKIRKRRVRSQADLLDNSDSILKTAETILNALDKAL